MDEVDLTPFYLRLDDLRFFARRWITRFQKEDEKLINLKVDHEEMMFKRLKS